MPGPDVDPIKITLVPELCIAVGLTDAQRADFRVMKDVADFTRLSPEKKLGVTIVASDRVQELKISFNRLCTI